MNSIIYNKFVELYLHNSIDLLEENTYKIALITDSYTPDKDTDLDFSQIQSGGFEIKDSNQVYKAGGKYVILKKMDTSLTDGIVQFTISKTTWKNITASNISQAILYRATDGLLIACYKFGYSISPIDDNVVLNWGTTPVLSLTTVEIKEEDPDTDNTLDTDSPQPIQNRAVVNALKNMGVVFTDDNKGLPTVEGMDAKDWEDEVTFVNMLTESEIDNIFLNVMGE